MRMCVAGVFLFVVVPRRKSSCYASLRGERNCSCGSLKSGFGLFFFQRVGWQRGLFVVWRLQLGCGCVEIVLWLTHKEEEGSVVNAWLSFYGATKVRVLIFLYVVVPVTGS